MPRAKSDLGSWSTRVLQYCSTNDVERDRARKKAHMSVFHPLRFRIGFVGAWGFRLNRWLRGAAFVARLLTVFGSERFLHHPIRLLGLRVLRVCRLPLSRGPRTGEVQASPIVCSLRTARCQAARRVDSASSGLILRDA